MINLPFDHKHLFLHYLTVKDCTQFHQEQFFLRAHSTTKALLYMAGELMLLEIHYSSQEATPHKIQVDLFVKTTGT